MEVGRGYGGGGTPGGVVAYQCVPVTSCYHPLWEGVWGGGGGGGGG